MILDGELVEQLLWECGVDFEFLRIDGTDTLVVNCGGESLAVETVWIDPDTREWFFDVDDIIFRSGSLTNLEFYGSSSADTETTLVEEILGIRDNLL